MVRVLKNRTFIYILVLILLIVPTFWRMLRPGIFSMQDYHTFRLYEFNKCIQDIQIPCRWTPDATFEYGQPTFDFYGQGTYWFGQLFRLLGFGVIDTIKALFVSSLLLSALAMFWLARHLWKSDVAALVTAIIYTYGPYRAVDVWVRAALPEALGFVFFPLVVLFLTQFLESKKLTKLFWFGLSLTLLVLTHNLSVFMLMFLLIPWTIFFVIKLNVWRDWRIWLSLVGVGILSLAMAAFYLLPVSLESPLVSIEKTYIGFYNYNNHFVTLKQLLISRFWGYGASTWGDNDGLSLSVGQLQWLVPLLLVIWILVRRQWRKWFLVIWLSVLGWFFLLLTHNKSVLIWNLIKPMEYLQFPWRFLGLAEFCFSLAAGATVLVIQPKKFSWIVPTSLIVLAIALNVSFYHEDLWHSVTDSQLFSGSSYEDQISSSANDFWPKVASQTPIHSTSKDAIFLEGSGSGHLVQRNSDSMIYQFSVISTQSLVQVPMVYFPGWVGYRNNKLILLKPSGVYGLMTMSLPQGTYEVNYYFRDTLVRVFGNAISVIGFIFFVAALIFLRNKKLK